MKKLYLIKKGKQKYYICRYDCGLYTIDMITKSVGYSVAVFDNLEDCEKYAEENGYKKIV